MRKFDLLVGMLILASIIVAAMAIDPKGFSLKEWQPLLAAVAALVGASIVYTSAMAKVNLDREIHDRMERRARRGVLLRAAFAMHMIGNSAALWATVLKTFSPGSKLNTADLVLVEVGAMDEIWLQLDSFPRDIAGSLGDLRVAIANFDRWKARLGAGTINISLPPPREIKEICDVFDLIAPLCAKIRKDVETLI